jgi:ABC-type Mn2+/Zn2+ transport system ATPase subunit
MSAEPMIECDGLTRRFGQFTAVDHVTFSVAKGSIFGFLGPMARASPPSSHALRDSRAERRARAHRRARCFAPADQLKGKLGYMSQKFSSTMS